MKQWILVISAIYLLSPFDLVPERIFGPVGLIEDVVVISVLYWFFIHRPRLAAQRRMAEDSDEQGEEDPEHGESPGSVPGTDPYKILGVAKDASAEEIKHAYRELANKYHPDKVSHLGDEFKAIADKKFKEIQRAYEELAPK